MISACWVTPARPGSSVELTVDRDLQYEVQSSLADRMAVDSAMAVKSVLDAAFK